MQVFLLLPLFFAESFVLIKIGSGSTRRTRSQKTWQAPWAICKMESESPFSWWSLCVLLYATISHNDWYGVKEAKSNFEHLSAAI